MGRAFSGHSPGRSPPPAIAEVAYAESCQAGRRPSPKGASRRLSSSAVRLPADSDSLPHWGTQALRRPRQSCHPMSGRSPRPRSEPCPASSRRRSPLACAGCRCPTRRPPRLAGVCQEPKTGGQPPVTCRVQGRRSYGRVALRPRQALAPAPLVPQASPPESASTRKTRAGRPIRRAADAASRHQSGTANLIHADAQHPPRALVVVDQDRPCGGEIGGDGDHRRRSRRAGEPRPRAPRSSHIVWCTPFIASGSTMQEGRSQAPMRSPGRRPHLTAMDLSRAVPALSGPRA